MNPYACLPNNAYWRTAVSEVHYTELQEIWEPPALTRATRVATAGSCFAQHIGNHLVKRGACYLDLEPAPPNFFQSEAEKRRFGYGVYSCRYGNIYTARQLRQLFEEAFEDRRPKEIVWQKGSRFFDALRPRVDPVGQDSPDTVIHLRNLHLEHVREMFLELELFVFTLGLTEGWESTGDHTMYPSAPGTICGTFNERLYGFRNFTYPEILSDLKSFWASLKLINQKAEMLLTISPVPLTATASGNHVLVASTYSKAVLRAVAGDLTKIDPNIHYFPSFELISTHPSRGTFFDPNLRTVSEAGVNYVMNHFFSGSLASMFPGRDTMSTALPSELICDEEMQDNAVIVIR
jgi:GSCFA family